MSGYKGTYYDIITSLCGLYNFDSHIVSANTPPIRRSRPLFATRFHFADFLLVRNTLFIWCAMICCVYLYI